MEHLYYHSPLGKSRQSVQQGGYGSGRTGYKQKAEDCRSIDIYKMKRSGCLEAGRRGNWIWSRDDEEVARIDYHCTGSDLVLNYRVRICGGDWERIEQTVPLTQTDCNFGGQRIYARCPGIVGGRHCQRRVGKLFAGGNYFLCRHCYDVGYYSQSETSADRALRRANKIRRELGGEPGTAHWIAPKPKGMWERTYRQKCWKIETSEHQANLLFLSQYRDILSPEELEMYFGDVTT